MTEASPLAEATTDSLEELFRRDPLKLTDLDIDAIVAELRARRGLWLQAAAEGKTRAPRAKVEAKPEIEAGDLF
jgi:hypothetical protein